MSWTKWQCCQCMARLVEHIDVDDRTIWEDHIYKCDGHCRKILPPRRVSTPKNLDPDAYDIRESGYDHEKWMIDGKIDILDK